MDPLISTRGPPIKNHCTKVFNQGKLNNAVVPQKVINQGELNVCKNRNYIMF